MSAARTKLKVSPAVNPRRIDGFAEVDLGDDASDETTSGLLWDDGRRQSVQHRRSTDSVGYGCNLPVRKMSASQMAYEMVDRAHSKIRDFNRAYEGSAAQGEGSSEGRHWSSRLKHPERVLFFVRVLFFFSVLFGAAALFHLYQARRARSELSAHPLNHTAHAHNHQSRFPLLILP